MGGDSEERELEMAIQLSNSAIQNQVGKYDISSRSHSNRTLWFRN